MAQAAKPTAPVADPSLASSATATADTAQVDPLASATTIPEENLPELQEVKKRNAYGVFFDVNAGTQGIGFNVGYEFNRYLKLRFRTAWLGASFNQEWDEMDVSAKFNGNTTGLLLDVHPFAGSFHVTGGFNFRPISVEAKGTMNSSIPGVINSDKIYSLGDKHYKYMGDGTGWVRGEYKWRSCMPYLGIGWSSNGEGDRGLYFSCDLGVNFIGTGKFSVQSSETGIYEVSSDGQIIKAVGNSELRDAIWKEGEDVFKIADQIFVYPVIQLGMGFRF